MTIPSYKSLVTLLAVVFFTLTLSFPVVSALAQPAPEDSQPLGEFGACVSAEKQGQLVLLLDQSGSLLETDPQKQRLVASKYLLERLVDFSEKNQIKMQVQVAGFSDRYYAANWLPATAQNLGQLQASVESYTTKLSPIDTDYVSALQGARSSLAQNRGEIPEKCQAIAWFTDGRYEVNARTKAEHASKYGTTKDYAPGVDLSSEAGAKQAMEMGQNELCRDGGLADQSRTEGITILGFGLKSPKADLSFMNSIVTSESCGKVKTPPGVMLSPENPTDLVFAFDSLATPGVVPLKFKVPTCTGGICPEGVVSFTMDDSITAVGILASSPVKEAKPILIDPSGNQQELKDYKNINENTKADPIFQFELRKADYPSWSGAWQLALVTPEAGGEEKLAKVNLRLYSKIETRWDGDLAKKARAGEALKDIKLQMVSSDSGEAFDASTLKGKVVVDAKIIDAKGQEFPVVQEGDASVIGKSLDVDLSKASPGKAVMMITTTITTAAATTADGQTVSGTQLHPQITKKDFNLAASARFPQIGATKLDFGTLEGKLSATASLPVTGNGCVWFKGSQVSTAPSETKSVKVSSKYNSEKNCFKATGQKDGMNFNLDIDELGNGGVNGTLTVVTAPADELSRQVEVPLTYTAQVLRPLDKTKMIISTVAATLLGILVPLLLLYLMKFLTAKIPRGQYRYFIKSVRVDQPQNLVLPAESEISSTHSASRSIRFGNIVLRARMSFNPLKGTRVELVEPVQMPSEGSAVAGNRKGRALVPQNITSQWVMLRESDQSVSVLVILDGSNRYGSRESWQPAVEKARQAITTVGVRLAEKNTDSGQEPAPAPAPSVDSGITQADGGWNNLNPQATLPSAGMPPTEMPPTGTSPGSQDVFNPFGGATAYPDTAGNPFLGGTNSPGMPGTSPMPGTNPPGGGTPNPFGGTNTSFGSAPNPFGG